MIGREKKLQTKQKQLINYSLIPGNVRDLSELQTNHLDVTYVLHHCSLASIIIWLTKSIIMLAVEVVKIRMIVGGK